MRYLRATVLVLAGASVLMAHTVAAQQRVVRLSDADQALMDDFWKSCAAPVAEAKRIMAGHPDTPSDAEFRQFMNGMPHEMREGAKFEKVPLNEAYYRQTIAVVRKSAADPSNTDPTTKFMTPVYICLLETMIRHHNGGGARAGTAAPPAPAPPAAPANRTPDADGHAPGCVVVDDSVTSFGGLRNNCSFPVYVTYCAYRPERGAWNEAFNCEKQQFGLDSIGANGTQAVHTKNAERIYVFACQKPRIPSQSKFDGTTMMSMCK